MFSAATKTDSVSGEPATEAVFTASGSWVVPAGVTSVSAVVIGGGGGGIGNANGGCGGSGGDLRTFNNLAVTPGETLTITVGAGGTGGTAPTQGGISRIQRGGTTLLQASGGGAGTISGSGARNGTSTAIGGSVSGGDGGTSPNTTTALCSGGGAAGGYAGAGGNGGAGTNSGTAGAGGGGGGGGGGGSSDEAGNGAGVNVFGSPLTNANGEGGAGSTVNGISGTAGSYGDGMLGSVSGQSSLISVPRGLPFGGAGGGADNTTESGNGGQGAVRIIWPGTTRTFSGVTSWMSQQLTTVINAQTTGALSISIPASAQAGDLAILTRTGFTAGAQTTPTGWTLVSGYSALTPINFVWYRILQAGDPGTAVSFSPSVTTPFNEMTIFRRASGAITSVTVSDISQIVNTSGIQTQTLNIPTGLSIAFQCAAVTDNNFHSSFSYFTGGRAGTGNVEPSAMFRPVIQTRYSLTRFRIYDQPPSPAGVLATSRIAYGGTVSIAFMVKVN